MNLGFAGRVRNREGLTRSGPPSGGPDRSIRKNNVPSGSGPSDLHYGRNGDVLPHFPRLTRRAVGSVTDHVDGQVPELNLTTPRGMGCPTRTVGPARPGDSGMPVTRKTCSCRILAMTQLVTSGPVQTPLPLLPLPLFTVSQAVLRLAAPRPFSCPCSRWQIKQLHKACTARPVCKCEKCDFCLFCKYAIFSFFQVWATVQATSTSLTKQSSFMVDVMTQNMESR